MQEKGREAVDDTAKTRRQSMIQQGIRHYRDVAKALKGGIARAGYGAVTDQALVSAANFFTTFYLARNMTQEGFGIFALGYTILLLVSSLQYGFITSPMMVLGAPLEGEKRKRYFGSLAIIQGLSAVVVVLLMFFARVAIGHRMMGELFVVLAEIVLFYVGQEYIRRGLFTVLDSGKAIVNDAICYGSQVAGLVLLSRLGWLTWEHALWVVGATSGIALVFGLFQFRESLSLRLSDIRETLLKHWHYGKWLLGSSLATYTSSQAYLFIAAFFLGPTAAGTLRAVQNVFGPTHVLLNGFGNFVPPIASRKYVLGGATLLKDLLKTVSYALLVLMAVYCLLVSLGAEFILRLLYKEQYVDSAGLVPLFALNYLIATLSIIIGFGLRAIQRTDVIFRAYVVSSIVASVVSIPLVYYFKLTGAVAGIVLSGAVVSLYTYQGLKGFWESNRT